MSDLSGTGRRVLLKGGKREPDKDLDHLLPKRPREAAGVEKRIHYTNVVLDQGSTSSCVIHGADQYLTTRPVVNKGWGTLEDRMRVYKVVQTMDEWPGEDYDGTSVRAMMKYLKKEGYINGYSWGFDCETVVNHVLAFGPVEMGTIWDAGMAQVDRYGYIFSNKDDADDEGHAWTIVGADRNKVHRPTGQKGAVRMVNSWGRGWGQNGRAWISFQELDKLIKLQGEAAVAHEVKRAA